MTELHKMFRQLCIFPVLVILFGCHPQAAALDSSMDPMSTILDVTKDLAARRDVLDKLPKTEEVIDKLIQAIQKGGLYDVLLLDVIKFISDNGTLEDVVKLEAIRNNSKLQFTGKVYAAIDEALLILQRRTSPAPLATAPAPSATAPAPAPKSP